MSTTPRPIAILSTVMFPLSLVYPQPGFAQELNSFAIISGQSLTNTGLTTINGNIAISPGISFTGRGSVIQTGTTYIGDEVGIRIQNDLTTLYTYLSGLPTSSWGNLTGQDLGGLTLPPGVYNFDSSALLSAGQTLTLDAGGDPDAVFIINIGSTLTVGSGANVILQNGAQGGNVFYRIGSSATLDTSSDFYGQIVALTSITMNTAASIDCGAAYARNGSVTLDTNTISICVLDSGGFDEVIPDAPTPVDPTPVDPTPVDPVPGEPVPGRPAPVDPVPGEPAPLNPAPGEPAPGQPVPGEPAPGEPAPGEPQPDVSLPAEPVPGEPEPDAPDVVENTFVISANAVSVAKALVDFEVSGGVLPLSFTILAATQTPEQLALSLGQMTGEVSTGVAPMGLRSMDAFLNTVSRSTLAPRLQLAAPRDVGIPVGRVPDRSNEYQEKYDGIPVAPELTFQAVMLPPTQSWNIWAAGFGGRSLAEGSEAAGTHRRTTDTSGLAFGVDLSPGTHSTFGAAFAFDRSNFALEDGFGTGDSEGISAAVYGTRYFDKGYVEVALAYAQNDVATDRTVTIAGADRFMAEVTTTNIAGRVEAGYYLDKFTPFVALRGQSLTVPTYAETAVTGPSTYALSYVEQTTHSLRSEVGVAVSLVGNDNASLGLRASWAHEFMEPTATTAEFPMIPGAPFSVSGAVPDRDSLILALHGEVGGAAGFYAGADVVAEYSSNAQDYGGSLTVGYRW